MSESIFKIPTLPSRYRRGNGNNTRSTYNNNAEMSAQRLEVANHNLKKIEEQFEVIKKICQPEEVELLSKEMIDRLNSVCYEKLAEQVLQPNSRGFLMGNCSVFSSNTRPSTLSIPDRTSEQIHRGACPTLNMGPSAGFFNAPSATMPVETKPCRTKSRTPGVCVATTVRDPTPPDTSRTRNKKKSAPLKNIEVLPSDDETLSDIFGKTKPATKPASKSKQNTNKNDLSVSLDRIEVNAVPPTEAPKSRKRKAPQEVENLVPSPDTTTVESVTQKVKEVRRSARNNSVMKKTGKENKVTAVKPSKSKTNKPQESEKKKINESLPKKVAETKSPAGFQEIDDASLFNDISSIVGTNSIQVTSNSVVKNVSKHKSTHASEIVSGIFSPFANNIRSTSGLSAVSTPLSKSVAKTVLSKRLKKPDVISELKDQLTRKPRKRPIKKDIIPLGNKESSSETSEEDCECSDFSD